MRFLSTLVASALVSLSNAAAIARGDVPPVPQTQYDAIIVGGGPAGLAALSGLARVRRNVLLIDSGEYRNAPTRHMHDVPGFDGEYYRICRCVALTQPRCHTCVLPLGRSQAAVLL